MFIEILSGEGLSHNRLSEMLAPFFRVGGINEFKGSERMFKKEDSYWWFRYETVVWLALKEDNALAKICLIKAGLL